MTLAIILGPLALVVLALAIFSTSRLKWLLLGFLYAAVMANTGHYYLITVLSFTLIGAAYAWDNHLRERKLAEIIRVSLFGNPFKIYDQITLDELNKVTYLLNYNGSNCFSLLHGQPQSPEHRS